MAIACCSAAMGSPTSWTMRPSPESWEERRSRATPANGSDFVLPDGQVYQENADGSFSCIPDVATGNAMGLDWNALTPIDCLPGPIGAPLPRVGD